MPSPGEDLYSWSKTASDNGSADALINWVEGQTRASVNNSSRSEMAAHAKNRDLINGSIATTGAKNAQAFISGVGYTTIPTGLVVKLKVGSGLTNDSSVTLNMDGIGDTIVKDAQGGDLLGGEFVAGGYVDLLWNGTNWTFLYSREFFFDLVTSGGGLVMGVQKFTASGVYTPTPGMECCIVECIAGGGGGGNAASNVTDFFAAGGGGSGGYSRKLLTAADIGTSQQITIGAAGGGGGGPAGSGGTGGDTYIGTTPGAALCLAKGGQGGDVAVSGIIPGGGAGGAAAGAVGDITAAGAAGGPGIYNPMANTTFVFSQTGEGGSSALGGGARSVGTSAAGITASNYGGGGSGACSYAGDGGKVGGGGSAGIVIITEFAGRGAPGRDGPQGPIGPSGPSGPGTGDVLRAGIPTAGQYAVWTDASHIQGVTVAVTPFTTGDIKATFKTVPDTGWVMCAGGTIGSATSGATIRANADCQALLTLFFNNGTDTTNPILTSAGAATTRAAQGTAATAWTNNCRMTLPNMASRIPVGAGSGSGLTTYTLGQIAGAQAVTLSVGNLAPHHHPSVNGINYMAFPGSGLGLTSGADVLIDNYPSTGDVGGGVPFSIVPPVLAVNWMIKL